MIWIVFGAFIVIGSLLTTVRDTKAAEGRPFVDRARLRGFGITLLALTATALVGYLILLTLANWVSSDL